MKTLIGGGASTRRLRRHVRSLEGERHPRTSPRALQRAADYIARELEGFGLEVATESFEFRGKTWENVVARKWGRSERPGWARTPRRNRRALLRVRSDGSLLPRVRVEEKGSRGNGGGTSFRRGGEASEIENTSFRRSRPRVLIGAHFDTIPGTPGADDNASGVAGLLEAARILSAGSFDATLEFVAFNLEELQTFTYRVGSRAYAEAARRKKVRYAGALILEMIGYRSHEPGSQRVPRLISWKGIPRTGDFIAVTGDGRSRRLMRHFREAAAEAVPELSLVAQRSPFRGWLIWSTRLSDNASFWSEGYPSLMITDTAFLRNPNYHRTTDTRDTLDFDFMAQVTDATVAAAERLAGGAEK